MIATLLLLSPCQTVSDQGALQHLQWLARFDEERAMTRDEPARLDERLGFMVDEMPERRDALRLPAGALLATAAVGLDRFPEREDYLGTTDLVVVRRSGMRAIRRAIRGPNGAAVLGWLTEEVVPLRQIPYGQRVLALSLIDEQRTDAGQQAVLAIARRTDDPLRADALEMLATWPGAAVDLFLVGLIGRKYDKRQRPHPFNVLLDRVRGRDGELSGRAAQALAERLRPILISTDWREASRAIELSRGLELERAMPLLMDALMAWKRRTDRGTGSPRIVDELVRNMRSRSGRSIGPNPSAWTRWWIAYRQGRVDVLVGEEHEPRSEATFFGLRPVSDRVTFVIDFSGSMVTEWGTGEVTRYQEAIDQMMRFLQASGNSTRFNVILFSDEPLRSTPRLVRATTDMLEKARASLLERTPDGNTFLRPAVELALRLDGAGHVDLDKLEADTVVILCDGETTEGPRWVAPLLDRVQFDARVVFHCVLIGHRGDGTLRQLAERTGGDFLRIGG